MYVEIVYKKICKYFIVEFLDDNWPSSTECSSVIKELYLLLFFSFHVVPYGLAVRIPGFHPGGPGSTPGMGISNFFHQLTWLDALFINRFRSV